MKSFRPIKCDSTSMTRRNTTARGKRTPTNVIVDIDTIAVLKHMFDVSNTVYTEVREQMAGFLGFQSKNFPHNIR